MSTTRLRKLTEQIEIDSFYVSEYGHTIRRERGTVTENGNILDGHWVLRNFEGCLVDFNRYRTDLFEQHGFVVINPL